MNRVVCRKGWRSVIAFPARFRRLLDHFGNRQVVRDGLFKSVLDDFGFMVASLFS